jgi:nucleoside-diphosphate-sugar epimerase
MNFQQIDYIKNDCKEVVEGNIHALKKLKGQSIFISGASGFMGKWVIEIINYLNENYDFNTCVFAHASSVTDEAEIYPSIYNNDLIVLIDGDIKNITEIDPFVSYVLHLASSPDNRVYSSDPIKGVKDIIKGTEKILAASFRLENLLNFTLLSSGMVYGPIPFTKDYIAEDSFFGFDSSSLSSFYPEAKRISESFVQAYRAQYKMPVTIFRPFAFIGPYQHIDRPWAINNFIRDGLRGEPIRIIGDEDTVRSYMYPSEMALWVLLGMLNQSGDNIFNLGSSDGKSIRQIAEKVEKSFGGNIGLSVNLPPNSSLKSKFVPSVEKFEQLFNLKLKINTEEAIKKTIEWHRLGH